MGAIKGQAAGCFASTYNPEVALAIVERIAEGETLNDICKSGTGLPARSTFRRWVIAYPELSRAYSAAREVSAHSLEEEALDLARELKNPAGRKKLTPTEIRALDVALDQLRWSATRRNPKVYSERGSINITVPIQINTSLDLAGPQVSDVYQLKANVELPQNQEQVEHDKEMLRPSKPLLTKKEQEAVNARRREANSVPS